MILYEYIRRNINNIFYQLHIYTFMTNVPKSALSLSLITKGVETWSSSKAGKATAVKPTAHPVMAPAADPRNVLKTWNIIFYVELIFQVVCRIYWIRYRSYPNRRDCWFVYAWNCFVFLVKISDPKPVQLRRKSPSLFLTWLRPIWHISWKAKMTSF
jgi:hypothetical protein